MNNLNKYLATYRIIFYDDNSRVRRTNNARARTLELEIPFSSIPLHERQVAESIRNLQELIHKPSSGIRHRVKLLMTRRIL